MTDTAIELRFGDGLYRFWLPMAQIVALEGEKRSVLAMHLSLSEAMRLMEDGTPLFVGGGDARARDIPAIIRHALIGGAGGRVDGETVAVTPVDASRLVEQYVNDRPIAETLPVAWAILNAAIHGVAPSKKKPVTDGDGDPSHSVVEPSSSTAEPLGSIGSGSTSAPTSQPSKRTTTRIRKGKAAGAESRPND